VADILVWLFMILVSGCLLIGVIGLLMPLILFAVGFGLAILALYILGWLIGCILS
jgi:hypothetical protein